MAYRNLNVLEAAELVVAELNQLIDRSSNRLLHVAQMRKSAQSIVANIGEAFGREEGRDRNRSLTIARAESEETIQHLKSNFRTHRVGAKDYWPIRNKIVVVVKMLNGLLNS